MLERRKQDMQKKLKQLLNNSYSPYSKFKVAAILVTKDGREFFGVNVENASYGATICAERSAFVSAISYGYHPYNFESLYVMVDSPKISTCCFLCRQVITEMMEPDKKIVCMNNHGEILEFTVNQLFSNFYTP